MATKGAFTTESTMVKLVSEVETLITQLVRESP